MALPRWGSEGSLCRQLPSALPTALLLLPQEAPAAWAIASLSASKHQSHRCIHSKSHTCIGVAPRHCWTRSLSPRLLLVSAVLPQRALL